MACQPPPTLPERLQQSRASVSPTGQGTGLLAQTGLETSQPLAEPQRCEELGTPENRGWASCCDSVGRGMQGGVPPMHAQSDATPSLAGICAHTHTHPTRAKLRHRDARNTIQSQMQTWHKTTHTAHTQTRLREVWSQHTQEDTTGHNRATHVLRKTHTGRTPCEHTDTGGDADKHAETQSRHTSHALDRDVTTDVCTAHTQERSRPGWVCLCCWRCRAVGSAQDGGGGGGGHTRGSTTAFLLGGFSGPRPTPPAPRPQHTIRAPGLSQFAQES